MEYSNAITREDESKWAIRCDEDYARFIALVGELGAELSPPRELEITDRYLDTPGWYMARARCRCRLRSQGARWFLTFKESHDETGEILSRREKNVELAHVRSERDALEYCQRQVFARVAEELVPRVLFSIRNRRESRDLRFPSGLRVESSFDRVEMTAGETSWHGLELELEMCEGDRDEFSRLVAELSQRTAFPTEMRSKYDRAAALCGLNTPVIEAPGYTFTAEATLAEAARKIIAAEREKILQSEPGVRVGVYSDAIHDMRVACRKIRAAARTFAATLPGDSAALIDEVTWFGRTLGSGRDLEVHTACLRELVASMAPLERELLEPFLRQLEERFEAERRQILAILDSPRYSAILRGLDELVSRQPAGGDGGGSIARGVPTVLHQCLRKMETFCPNGTPAESVSDDELHRLRIRLKRVRYLGEFFLHIAGAELGTLLEQTRAVQKSLGLHQDYRVGRDLVSERLEREEDAASRAALEKLRERVEVHKQAHRDAFMLSWPQYWALSNRIVEAQLARESVI